MYIGRREDDDRISKLLATCIVYGYRKFQKYT